MSFAVYDEFDVLVQFRCPACGRFISIDEGYGDVEPGGLREHDPITAYCSEACADRKSPKAREVCAACGGARHGCAACDGTGSVEEGSDFAERKPPPCLDCGAPEGTDCALSCGVATS